MEASSTASSTVVIKVKYGGVLRRFNASIVDEKLFLSMDGLREKIISLFSFAHKTNLMLTYADEDGDKVALVDDDDLHDAVKQGLNPLRVTVKVKDDNNGNQNYSNASSTPLSMKSPHVQHLPNVPARVSVILTKVPEPLRETLLKLSDDLAVKTSLSAQSVSELVDHLSKVSSFLGQQLSESGVTLNMQNDVPESSSAAENNASEPFKVDPTSKLEKVKPAENMERKEVKIQNVTGQKEGPSFDSHVVASALESENIDPSKPESVDVANCSRRKEKVKKTGGCSNGKSRSWKVAEFPVSSSNLPSQVDKKLNDGSYTKNGDHGIDRTESGLRDETPQNGGLNFGSLGPPHCASDVDPSRRINSQNDSSWSIVHHEVCCDGCDTHPIVGPRFKSNVKVNYDLCHGCFEKMGNDKDYFRMDSPAVSRQHSPNFRARQHGPWFSHVHRVSKGKHGVVNLDSRFIQDVKIFDGAVMAPLTPFTKIWRMRNNGTVAWPQKTQLVWIGGDKLTDTHSVELKIPAAGVLMDQELDVAVDFISPQLPGRYISYWRMASPYGPKFGQRIWVLIHVDASKNETPQDSVGNLNLNLPLPPASSTLTGPEMIGVDPAPGVEASSPKAGYWKKVVESRLRDTENELRIPINYSLLVGNRAGSSSAGPSSSLPGLYPPIIDLTDKEKTLSVLPPISMLQQTYSMPAPVSPFTARTPFLPPVLPASTAKRVPMPPPPPPPVPATAPEPDTQLPENDLERLLMEHPENDLLEEKLLWELEEMGFKQVHLNKEVLRMNEYDLGQAVDDLCGVAKWDPIIEEQLEEMDFHDTEMNKQLLKKNNGSIKRVVMDLIAGEEA